jgi:hypothetical protein
MSSVDHCEPGNILHGAHFLPSASGPASFAAGSGGNSGS